MYVPKVNKDLDTKLYALFQFYSKSTQKKTHKSVRI